MIRLWKFVEGPIKEGKIKLETFRTQILFTHAPFYGPNLFLNQKLAVLELISHNRKKFRP